MNGFTGRNEVTFGTTAGTSSEIKRPKRIERGPTDVLKALSGTVGLDPTAAHFKFHDDPYLMPYSNPTKRTYALSQEAGRKAARWIREQHSDLFQHKTADPMIPAYVPNVPIDDNSKVDEELLRNLVDKQQVSDVINVYEIMTKRGLSVDLDTKQRILELTSFYNNLDPLSEEWIEENWFRQGNQKDRGSARLTRKVWKDGGTAERIFDELIRDGGDSSKAHTALIAGMLKHGEVERGWKLYEECKANGITLGVDVYNAIIVKSPFVKESHDMVWQLVVKTLNEMEAASIHPNLATLNGILHTLEVIGSHRFARTHALSAIAEFRQLNVEPSLASYAHLARIFKRDVGQLGGVLENVIAHLEQNLHLVSPQTPEDNKFFTVFMESINHLGDVHLASRLDKLLHNAKNYSLIGSSFNESIYYRNYFLVTMKYREMDEFMEFYQNFVPNLYIPEISVTLELLKTIEVHLAWKYIPKIWNDIILFEQVRPEVVTELLSLTAQATLNESSLASEMASTTWSIWQKMESGTVRNLEWTSEMLSNALRVLLLANELPKAHLVMDKIDRAQDLYTGEPDGDVLAQYVDVCLDSGNVDSALKCVRYCDSRGRLDTESLLKKVANSPIQLDDAQKRVVEELQQKL